MGFILGAICLDREPLGDALRTLAFPAIRSLYLANRHSAQRIASTTDLIGDTNEVGGIVVQSPSTMGLYAAEIPSGAGLGGWLGFSPREKRRITATLPRLRRIAVAKTRTTFTIETCSPA